MNNLMEILSHESVEELQPIIARYYFCIIKLIEAFVKHVRGNFIEIIEIMPEMEQILEEVEDTLDNGEEVGAKLFKNAMDLAMAFMALTEEDRLRFKFVAFSKKLRCELLQSFFVYWPKTLQKHQDISCPAIRRVIDTYNRLKSSSNDKTVHIARELAAWIDNLADLVGPDKYLWVAVTSDDRLFGGDLSTNSMIEQRRAWIKNYFLAPLQTILRNAEEIVRFVNQSLDYSSKYVSWVCPKTATGVTDVQSNLPQSGFQPLVVNKEIGLPIASYIADIFRSFKKGFDFLREKDKYFGNCLITFAIHFPEEILESILKLIVAHIQHLNYPLYIHYLNKVT